jgi:hypothetical protein
MSNPSPEHFEAVDRIFVYLNKYLNYGIIYKGLDLDKTVLKAYSDSDWGSCLDSRRSTTGYITTLNGNIISWGVSLQQTVA